MKRTQTQQTPEQWILDYGPGGVVVAKHKTSGAVVVAHLVLRGDNGSARFRIDKYEHLVEGGLVTDGPPAPLELIEEQCNRAGDLQIILDMLMDPAATTDRVPMKLPSAWLEVRSKPDAFYERVAAFVRLSDEHGAKYGPRLAEDNGVPVGTVYSWVAEARKRGHLPAVEPKS